MDRKMPAVDPLDPWRAANLLLQQHGNDAAAHAMQRALDLRAAGDERGAAVWLKVFDCIHDLQRRQPPQGSMPH